MLLNSVTSLVTRKLFTDLLKYVYIILFYVTEQIEFVYVRA